MEVYNTVQTGELAGSATAVQMPDIPCRMAMFKAAATNTGLVCVGAAGVTLAAGTTNTTTGLELATGEQTPWIPIHNLNLLYYICAGAGDDLIYLAVG